MEQQLKKRKTDVQDCEKPLKPFKEKIDKLDNIIATVHNIIQRIDNLEKKYSFGKYAPK
jgi:hypothetical protein